MDKFLVSIEQRLGLRACWSKRAIFRVSGPCRAACDLPLQIIDILHQAIPILFGRSGCLTGRLDIARGPDGGSGRFFRRGLRQNRIFRFLYPVLVFQISQNTILDQIIIEIAIKCGHLDDEFVAVYRV